MRIRFLPTLAASFLAVALATPALADEPEGVWLTEGGDAALSFSHCSTGLCARIAWLEDPTDETGGTLLDEKNPDRAKQHRPVCGIPVMGLQPTGADSWQGSVYNPQDGRTYQAKVKRLSDDKLHIRAFLGLPMLGRSETWTRAEGREDRYHCQARTAQADTPPAAPRR